MDKQKRDIKKFINKNKSIIIGFTVILLVSMCLILTDNEKIVATSSQTLSTKKIEWGIKRNDSHKQPDLGSTNKRIMDELNRNSNWK